MDAPSCVQDLQGIAVRLPGGVKGIAVWCCKARIKGTLLYSIWPKGVKGTVVQLAGGGSLFRGTVMYLAGGSEETVASLAGEGLKGLNFICQESGLNDLIIVSHIMK